jgi:uncharacterized protein YutE (UPF0331/DUF86 family)
MVDLDILSRKLAELRDRLARVREHCPATPETLAADRDALDLVSFNLLLAVQACLDVASHLIADQGWEPAATARESFLRLQKHEAISAQTAAALQQAAAMRNLLVHVYADADAELIHDAAMHGLVDLERFAAEVASWLQSRR